MALAPAELELEPCGAPAAATTSWELLRAAFGPAAPSTDVAHRHLDAAPPTPTPKTTHRHTPGPASPLRVSNQSLLRHGLRVRHAAHRRAPRLLARPRAKGGGARYPPGGRSHHEWSTSMRVATLLLVAPCAFALLQPFAPLRTHAAVSMSRPALVMRADEHPGPVTPTKAQRSILRRNLDRVGTALAIGVASVMMRAPPAFAARKAVAPTPPQPVKINGPTKLGIGFGISGTFILVSHLSTEAENAEEKKRVAKEVKKMKDMAKEFTDIDGGVDADKVRALRLYCACASTVPAPRPSRQHRVCSLEPCHRVYSLVPAPCMYMHMYASWRPRPAAPHPSPSRGLGHARVAAEEDGEQHGHCGRGWQPDRGRRGGRGGRGGRHRERGRGRQRRTALTAARAAAAAATAHRCW
eukprot:scaffold49115_cov62-Phaeocystis_antarctica.AAC.5